MKNCMHMIVAGNPEGDRWCADCGEPLDPAQNRCGHEVVVGTPEGERWCDRCGKFLYQAPPMGPEFSGVSDSVHTDKVDDVLEYTQNLTKMTDLLRTEVFEISHRVSKLTEAALMAGVAILLATVALLTWVTVAF